MCKETFLRLPEEKRARVLNAAWDEFTTVSFEKASVNRIIRAAGIPRGSFYQYFEDKSDLFHDLMTQIHDQLTESYRKVLSRAEGNLFRSTLMSYDLIIAEQKRGKMLPAFERCMRVARINPGIDLETLGRGYHPERGQIIEECLRDMDVTPFRRQDTRFLTEVCCMAGMFLVGVLMDCLMNPGQEAERRAELTEALDILRRGSYTEEALRDAESLDALRGAETLSALRDVESPEALRKTESLKAPRGAELRNAPVRGAENREGGFA